MQNLKKGMKTYCQMQIKYMKLRLCNFDEGFIVIEQCVAISFVPIPIGNKNNGREHRKSFLNLEYVTSVCVFFQL